MGRRNPKAPRRNIPPKLSPMPAECWSLPFISLWFFLKKKQPVRNAEKDMFACVRARPVRGHTATNQTQKSPGTGVPPFQSV